MYEKRMEETLVGPFRLETLSPPCHRRYRQPRRDVLDAMPRSSRSLLGPWFAGSCVTWGPVRLACASLSPIALFGGVVGQWVCAFAVPFCGVLAFTGSRSNDSAQKPRTKTEGGNGLLCPRCVALPAKTRSPHIALSERCNWLLVCDPGERSQMGPVAISAFLAYA